MSADKAKKAGGNVQAALDQQTGQVVISTSGGDKSRRMSEQIKQQAEITGIDDGIEIAGLDPWFDENIKDLPAARHFLKIIYVRLTALEAQIERSQAGKRASRQFGN